MKKRLFGLLLAMLLALSVCSPPALAAEQTPAPKFQLNYQWDASKTHLAITVSIVNNPGIAGYDITLVFSNNLASKSTGISVSQNSNWSNSQWITTENTALADKELRVICANARNVTGSTAALCTVTFTVSGDNAGIEELSVSGKAASASMQMYTPTADSCKTHPEDVFYIEVTDDHPVITTYGNGYYGKLRLIVSAYRENGQFICCRMTEVTLEQGTEEREITECELNFPISSTSPGASTEIPVYRLVVLDDNFVPLTYSSNNS